MRSKTVEGSSSHSNLSLSIIQSRDEGELLYSQYNRRERCEQTVK